MALSELQQAEIKKCLSAFCEARVRPAVRDKLRIGFRMKGNEVVLFEERPGFQRPQEWHEMAVAKFRYVGTQRLWRLTVNTVICAGTHTRLFPRTETSGGCSMKSQLIQRGSSGASMATGLSNRPFERPASSCLARSHAPAPAAQRLCVMRTATSV
jgi:hypothetical protein